MSVQVDDKNKGGSGDQGGQGGGNAGGGGNPGGAGGDAGGQGGGGEHMLPKSRVDAEIAKTRAAEERAATLQKQIDADADAKKKAQEKADLEQGKFRELAESREKERDSANTALTAEKDRTKALSEQLNKVYDAEIEGWPDEVKAFVPGPEDVVARGAAIEKARPLAAKLMATGEEADKSKTPHPPGTTTPKPKAPATATTEEDEQAKAANARRFRR